MGGSRKLLALLATAACAATLTACGGADNDSGTTASGGATAAGGGGASQAAGSGNRSGGNGSGGGTAGVETSDDSLREFGHEASGGDKVEAHAAVEALFDAYLSGNWDEVCSKYLSQDALDGMMSVIVQKKSPQIEGHSCPQILGALYQSSGKALNMPKSGIAVVRIEGDFAFAMYRGLDGKGYALPLKNERGRWKLIALGPTPLEF